MKCAIALLSSILFVTACGRFATPMPGHGGIPLNPPLKPIELPANPPSDWIKIETDKFQFFHPDPDHKGAQVTWGPMERGGHPFTLPALISSFKNSHDEVVPWMTEGTEYLNSDCATLVHGHVKAKLNSQHEVYYRLGSLHDGAKILSAHNFLISGKDKTCLELNILDSSKLGTDHDTALDDKSDAAKFIVGVIASVAEKSEKSNVRAFSGGPGGMCNADGDPPCSAYCPVGQTPSCMSGMQPTPSPDPNLPATPGTPGMCYCY